MEMETLNGRGEEALNGRGIRVIGKGEALEGKEGVEGERGGGKGRVEGEGGSIRMRGREGEGLRGRH